MLLLEVEEEEEVSAAEAAGAEPEPSAELEAAAAAAPAEAELAAELAASLSMVTAKGPLVQSIVRWTFCSSTHPPSRAALATSLDATSSWPWPSETAA